jgi:hypothetical protein
MWQYTTKFKHEFYMHQLAKIVVGQFFENIKHTLSCQNTTSVWARLAARMRLA